MKNSRKDGGRKVKLYNINSFFKGLKKYLLIITYRCFNKLWTIGADQFNTLKDINDLNNFHSVHKIRNCDVGSTSSRTITRRKI
jgi:hypothetical protein